MPSFMYRFNRSQNLDTKDTAQSHALTFYDLVDVSIFLRRRMMPIASMLHFCRGRILFPMCYSPSHSPSPSSPSLDIRPPSGLGRRASIISELDMAHTNSPVSSTFPRMSKIASVQLALYRTLELSIDDVDACVAPLAGAPHLVVFMLHSYPLALASALRSMPALPAFDPELLADTLPYATFHHLLATPACTRLALPYIVGVPPAAQDVPFTAALRVAVVDSTPGLAAALAPSRPHRRRQHAEFVLVPVRARAAVRRAGKHGHGARAESRNEALRTLRLQVALVTEAAQAEEARLELPPPPTQSFSWG
ncbi:hypothetical protein EDB87DRAFT_1835186, partial [Lactarius vividus]